MHKCMEKRRALYNDSKEVRMLNILRTPPWCTSTRSMSPIQRLEYNTRASGRTCASFVFCFCCPARAPFSACASSAGRRTCGSVRDSSAGQCCCFSWRHSPFCTRYGTTRHERFDKSIKYQTYNNRRARCEVTLFEFLLNK